MPVFWLVRVGNEGMNPGIGPLKGFFFQGWLVEVTPSFPASRTSKSVGLSNLNDQSNCPLTPGGENKNKHVLWVDHL